MDGWMTIDAAWYKPVHKTTTGPSPKNELPRCPSRRRPTLLDGGVSQMVAGQGFRRPVEEEEEEAEGVAVAQPPLLLQKEAMQYRGLSAGWTCT